MTKITLHKFDVANSYAMVLFKGNIPTFHGMRKRRRLYRNAIMARDNGVCQYCKGKSNNKRLTLDHIYPQSMFKDIAYGDNCHHVETNLIVACDNCNTKKGSDCWRQFAQHVSLLYGEPTYQIIARIEATLRNKRPILPIVQNGKVTGYKMGF